MNFKHLFKLLPLLLFSVFSHANIQQMQPQILLELLQNQQAPLLLDVRSPEEFQQGHIQGAVNIPYDQLAAKSNQLEQYKNEQIIVYCRSGRRANVAENILLEQGFTQVFDLKGHMNLWQQYQYPLFIKEQIQ